MKYDKKQLSYIDKLREKYPKVNETDEWFSYCPADLFNGKNVNCREDAKCSYDPTNSDSFANCVNCWREQCPDDISFPDDPDLFEEFEADYFEHYPNETPAESVTENDAAEPKIITERAEAIAGTFNYAVLTAEMGDFLKRKEQQLKNEYMNFTANCGQIFAEAQEKLSREKDGNGMFLKWIESMGFKKDTVYRMIDIQKFRVSQIAKLGQSELFDNLSKSLQYEIAKPSAPPELVEQVLNGDITTHKDYMELKKQLEDTQKQAENAEMLSRTYQKNYLQMSKNFEEACEENTNLDERIKELEKLDKEILEENTDLHIKLKEAESRPHDTVVDVEEVNRRVAEAAAKLQNQTAQQIAEERKTYGEKIDRMQSTIDDLENKLADKKQTDVKTFAVRLTLKNFDELLKFIDSCDNASVKQAIKQAKIIKID